MSDQIIALQIRFGPVEKQPPDKHAGRPRHRRTIARVVLEHGVQMTWPDPAGPNEDRVWEELRAFVAASGLCPILVIDRCISGELESLVGIDGQNLSTVPTSMIVGGEDSRLYQQMASVQYILDSVIYHCKRLANNYCETYARIAADWFNDVASVDCCLRSDIYFEFDALVTSIQRGYDLLRLPLWTLFGSNGGRPSNFPDTLAGCVTIPDSLKEQLRLSWEAWGVPVTEYRHCIQHYIPVDTWHSTVTVEQLDDGRRKVLALIPDNPEARSKEKFRYGRRIDALSFGWRAADELLRIAGLVRGALRDKMGS